MHESNMIIWQEVPVGEISDISVDMWYLEGKWGPLQHEKAAEFERQLAGKDMKDFLKDPNSSLGVVLKYPDGKLSYCLAFSIFEQSLCLRRITSTELLEKFFPTKTGNPSSEKEVRNLSFFAILKRFFTIKNQHNPTAR